ncbi:spinster family MFS transporter [Endozoicomonas ascidiicola]|uniref:spinster family MFS transporter n=1 Tax=Endozoicomonas ascidiicola TaxID=1698521 RepID=UPI00082D1CF6|nr:MFS transporter [Endozoicomonas ascidiicola]
MQNTAVEAAPEVSSNDRPAWRTHLTLVLLALIYVFSFIDRNVIAIVLEPIKQEFGASDTMMGLISGLAFAILYGGLSLPLGRLADQGADRRNMIAICCSLWSLATMACGMVGQFWQLFIARMSVAVGEAGGMAPSVSMVSDLYPKERRSLAISVLMMGPHIGVLAAMVLGGWIAQEFGWRYVFIIFGAPGIVLALALRLIARDPGRGGVNNPQSQAAALNNEENAHKTPFIEQLKIICRIPGFLPISLGAAAAGMAGYSFGIWTPTFMVRNWDMSLAQAGLIFGLSSGVLAVIGSTFSGWYCDRLTKKDVRWQVRLPLIGLLISLPFALAFLLWPAEKSFSLGGYLLPQAIIFAALFSFFNSWWPTLTYAAISHVTTDRQRATGAAVLNLLITLFGAGLGPLTTGILSDQLSGTFGDDGLKYALACTTLVLFTLSVVFYKLALKPYKQRMADLQS